MTAQQDPTELPSSNGAIDFSIAVLCYRAENRLVPFVDALERALRTLPGRFEIILVANFWPRLADRTPIVARAAATRLPTVRVVAEPKQGGMGWDMRAGLDACRGHFVGVVDGDGQFPVESVVACFEAIAEGGADLVKTYRHSRADGWQRRLLSGVYNTLFRLLFPAYRPHRDVNSKPKVLRRRSYERMKLTSTDWFFDAELVLEALRLGLVIRELPIEFGALGGRSSFVNAAAIWEFLRNMVTYRLRYWARRSRSSHR